MLKTLSGIWNLADVVVVYDDVDVDDDINVDVVVVYDDVDVDVDVDGAPLESSNS